MNRRTFAKLGCALLLGVVAVDVGLTLFVVRDGVFVWRPLPPFSACMTLRQKEWLSGEQRELASGAGERNLQRFDAELGWCPSAGRHTEVGDPTQFHYNALGARSLREYAPVAPPGVLRIACFGDSFTHCDEVDDADTWEAQLEELEPEREALNFGVGGYGTDQALLRFRREGLHGARVLCVGFLIENIGRNVNRYRPWYHPPSTSCGAKPRFLLEGDELKLVPLPYATRAELIDAIATNAVERDLREHEYWFEETQWKALAPSSLARLAGGWLAYRRRNVERLYAARDAEPYRVTRALLERFVVEGREHGAEASVIVFFPRRAELEALSASGERHWRGLVDDLEARGIAVIDTALILMPAFLRERADATAPRVFQGGHLSIASNALVAQALERWLEWRFPER